MDYRRSREPEDYPFAGFALLFALAELVFMDLMPWDARSWFWHRLQLHLSACALTLGDVTCQYLRTISDLEASLVQTKRAEEPLRRSEGRPRQALEDRERMAQDLHDGAIQSLFATTLSLDGPGGRRRSIRPNRPANWFRPLPTSKRAAPVHFDLRVSSAAADRVRRNRPRICPQSHGKR